MSAALLVCSTAAAAAQTAQLVQGDVVLHHWSGNERLAAALLPPPDGLQFPGLPAATLQQGTPVHVYLAPDAARWDSLTGGRAPEWGAGIAIPALHTVVLPGYTSERVGTPDLPQILRHELAHIALHRHLGERIPRWFSEGYAMWSARQFEGDAAWKLRLAFVSRRAPTLDSLTLDWPLLAADAELAYLLSGTAMRYLYSLGSPATFERFLETWRGRGSFEDALREVYVLSSPQFERQWRSHVKRQYGWLQVFAQTGFVWLILTIAVIVLFTIRRRRDRKRLALLRAAEPPDEPAYWKEELDSEPHEPGGDAPDAPR